MTSHPQPLDALMTKLGLSNADLVKASTEQLSFKMVQKGRTGDRRVSPNVQEKILNALAAAKPTLKLRRRDLFRYEMNEEAVTGLRAAIEKVGKRQVNYPQFVDLLLGAGLIGYHAEVASAKYTFYGTGGEAHVEQLGEPITTAAPGMYNETALKAAIADAQKEKIDHPTFLKRIYESGIHAYEVNLRRRHIDYKGEARTYRESIPTVEELEAAKQAASKPAPPPAAAGQTLSKKVLKKTKGKAVAVPVKGVIRRKGKKVKTHRVKPWVREKRH